MVAGDVVLSLLYAGLDKPTQERATKLFYGAFEYLGKQRGSSPSLLGQVRTKKGTASAAADHGAPILNVDVCAHANRSSRLQRLLGHHALLGSCTESLVS
jgi:hypothetical protein